MNNDFRPLRLRGHGREPTAERHHKTKRNNCRSKSRMANSSVVAN